MHAVVTRPPPAAQNSPTSCGSPNGRPRLSFALTDASHPTEATPTHKKLLRMLCSSRKSLGGARMSKPTRGEATLETAGSPWGMKCWEERDGLMPNPVPITFPEQVSL
jgi:hypothetical protein